jgi:ABC-2 type transport system ATP-binding protein
MSLSEATAENGVLPLVVDSVVKRFGELVAVDGVSLELREGECLGLLGPNGAGKSTLIRSIVGRVKPDAGAIAVLGAPAESAAAREALGWVPQELAIYPRLSCRENLQAFGRYHGITGEKLEEAVTWGLKWSSLEDRGDELTRNLSGGKKRRLNMAAGLLHRPRVVLMDEPTVGVDPQSRNHIFEMIAELRAAGAALVYTTHHMEEAERLCDRIAIIDHGKVIAQGSKEELIKSTFGDRTQALARFAGGSERVAEWVAGKGGRWIGPEAEFTLEHPSEIARLLESATEDGLALEDLALHRPNLESVFLHLTGRELRD